MAYNNYFPSSYMPQYYTGTQYQGTQMSSPQQQSGIIWVQGEAGAKSWAVAPGKSVMLMDSESNTFYIKSSDNSGMPMPLRIFDYTERTQPTQHNTTIQHQNIDTSQFVTWDALNKRLNEIIKQEVNNDGKSTV